MKTIKNVASFFFWAFMITSSLITAVALLRPRKKYYTVVGR